MPTTRTLGISQTQGLCSGRVIGIGMGLDVVGAFVVAFWGFRSKLHTFLQAPIYFYIDSWHLGFVFQSGHHVMLQRALRICIWMSSGFGAQYLN